MVHNVIYTLIWNGWRILINILLSHLLYREFGLLNNYVLHRRPRIIINLFQIGQGITLFKLEFFEMYRSNKIYMLFSSGHENLRLSYKHSENFSNIYITFTILHLKIEI